MSLRAFFSRLFSSHSTGHRSDNGLGNHQLNNDKANSTLNKPSNRKPLKTKSTKPKWRYYLLQFFIALTLLLSAVWLLLATWYQFGGQSVITWFTTITVIGLLAALLAIRLRTSMAETLINRLTGIRKVNSKRISAKTVVKSLIATYTAFWLIGLGWFFSIEAEQSRDWMPEVSERVTYRRDPSNPDLITLTNVRNFDWHTDTEATERWETRTIDMSKLSGIDVSNSYWMGPLIAHTLVSFRFEDERPLAFSFEIRKENGESFSALAGFFRRFELSLIAAEERDIIYTRTNARGEQVYLFPISHLQQHEVKALFESYLTAADELNAKPAWYNTLTSNCTNIIFYMARLVSDDRLPWDYRIWVSGWLPNYLHDAGMLDANPENTGQPWSMDTWYERTHINPKVKGFQNSGDIHGSEFSRQIRQSIPIPPLADSQNIAEANAKSAAQASH